MGFVELAADLRDAMPCRLDADQPVEDRDELRSRHGLFVTFVPSDIPGATFTAPQTRIVNLNCIETSGYVALPVL